MKSELRSKLNSNSKKIFSFISCFIICILFLSLTFIVGMVKAEANSFNQELNQVKVSNQVKVCGEIFLNFNSVQQLNFEKSLHALAKSAARVIIENTGRPHDTQRDMLVEKINQEARAHIKTEEQKQRYGHLILKYQKELRAEINQKQQAELKKEKQREKKLKEQEKEVKKRNHPVSANSKAKMIFHEIEPGSFDMNYEVSENNKIIRKTAQVTITKPYALAQYETTQMQWSYLKILMGAHDPENINPSEFKEGPKSVSVSFELNNGEKVEVIMQPDNPVENINWNTIIYWIKGLNELSQSGNEFIQKELQRIVPGHLKGDVYELPTEEQWAFVSQNRGKNNQKYFDRDNDSDIKNYAVYDENSQIGSYKGTHEVGSKYPRKIDRGDGVLVDFYDFEGNVMEWTNDIYNKNHLGEIDLQGSASITSSSPALRGSSWADLARFVRSSIRSGSFLTFSNNDIGFRLARTRP